MNFKQLLYLCGCLLAFSLFLAPEYSWAAPVAETAQDMTYAYVALGILGVAALLFFTEIFPLPVTAMLVPCALSISGILSAKDAFSHFGDSSVILFMAMFILGEGTFATGFATRVAEATVHFSKGSEKRLLVYSIITIGALSGFLSNTGTTAVALPMILAMCAAASINPSKLLMPIAFASSLGGTTTLVGTPPNLLINATLEKMGAEASVAPFGFFEFALIGGPMLLMGILFYSTVGGKLLPDREPEMINMDEVKLKQPRRLRVEKMPIAMGIFIFVIIAMATKIIDLVPAAMLGAMLMVITRCISMKEAFNSIDWTTIFLFAGMISMSQAMKETGAASLIASSVVSLVSEPYAILAVTCALTMLITNFMSNTATAALMAPLAIPIALQSGVSPLPVAMGIAISASACFITPIATPPNTLVFGPGNYSFIDYLKAGWPLQLLSFIMCVTLIPLIWPF